MDRRSFFATLTAISAVTVLPKVKTKYAPRIRTGHDTVATFNGGCWNTESSYFDKDDMHLE